MRQKYRDTKMILRLIYDINSVIASMTRALKILPLVARFIFLAVFAVYFWSSALTKLGDGVSGLFLPSAGAYIQIFPKTVENYGYDVSQLSVFHWGVVMVGTYAEFILPAMIILGLMTRLSALGMLIFVVMQSLTDLYGHGLISDNKVLGAWFDRSADGIIFDQRVLWGFLLLYLFIYGAGKISLDGWISSRVRTSEFN